MTPKLLIPTAISGLVGLFGSAARLLVLNAPGLGGWLVLGIVDSQAGGQLAEGFDSLAIFVVATECVLFAILGLLLGVVCGRSQRKMLPTAGAVVIAVLLQALFSIQVSIF